jgi:hypothetical protein
MGALTNGSLRNDAMEVEVPMASSVPPFETKLWSCG